MQEFLRSEPVRWAGPSLRIVGVAICGTGQSCCSVYCREWVPQSAPPTGPDEWGADTGASPVPSALIVYSAFCSTRPQRTNTSLAPSGDQDSRLEMTRTE